MGVVLVHGVPESDAIWRPLQDVLRRDATGVALPGLGTARPDGFSGTKDALAEWLAETLARFEPPVDVVGHDVGALLTMRVASAFDVPLRSWVVDVADVFHPDHVWPERVRMLQQAGVGEQMLEDARTAVDDDPRSVTARLIAGGVPRDLAREIVAAADEAMGRSILDFYRSAIPNVAADWWKTLGPLRGEGLSSSYQIRWRSRRCRSPWPTGSAPRPNGSGNSITAGWPRHRNGWRRCWSSSGPHSSRELAAHGGRSYSCVGSLE